MQTDVKSKVLARLTPVSRRQRRRAVLEAVGRGLICGSAVAVAIGLVNLALATWPLLLTVLPQPSRWLVRWALLPGLGAVALLVGPSTSAWLAFCRRPNWRAAAAAVDRHYGLQDRTVTALGFLEKADRKLLEEMQIADCGERLAQVDPR